MANHFLTKTQISLGQCLPYGDGVALDAYETLQEVLLGRAGEASAKLFAEPLLSRGNDTAAASVSWYTDLEGAGQPMARLDSDSQAALQEKLTTALAPLEALVDDPQVGALVGAALYQTDKLDVWAVGGEPVLINWAMLPAGLGREPSTRGAHYAATLGRFLPLAKAPPLAADEIASVADDESPSTGGAGLGTAAAAVGVAGVAAAGAGAAAASAATPEDGSQQSAANVGAGEADGVGGASGGAGGAVPPASEPPRRVPIAAWLPLVLLLLLASGVLAWLLIPGNRLFPDYSEAAIPDSEALAAAEGVNRALQERLAILENALSTSVCRSDGTLLMPDGRTIEGLLPPQPYDQSDLPGTIQPAAPTPVLPPATERVQVPDAANPQSPTDLLTHIVDRTAIVLAPAGGSLGTGTGFFVGPDLLVTNHHVIADAQPGGIFVTSEVLGSVREAQVLKTFGPLEQVGGDFALLRVAGVNQPFFSVRQPQSSLRLQSVIAAGYPGDVLQSDAQFQELRRGNAQAVPQLAVTDGTISTEQRMNATDVVVHSAPISQGNSGGPLIDMCGNVIGVNTFVKTGPIRSLNFALASVDLLDFLQGTAAQPQVTTQNCQPQVARPTVPQAQLQVPAQQDGTSPTLPPLVPQSGE